MPRSSKPRCSPPEVSDFRPEDNTFTHYVKSQSCLQGKARPFGRASGEGKGGDHGWQTTVLGAAADISTLVGVGVPVDSYNFDFLLGVRTPGLTLHETRDEFGSAVRVAELDDSLAEPKQIHRVQVADHFFGGKLDGVQEVLRQFFALMASKSPSPKMSATPSAT